MTGFIRSRLSDAHRVLGELLEDAEKVAQIETFADWVEACYRCGGKILAAGNGGSLADAMHFAEEWTGRFMKDREAMPAIALSDPTHLTCVSNDFGFEHVFSRMISALASDKDLVILLSTSGNSPNLLMAAETARKKGAKTVALVGKGGGKLAPMCDLAIDFPGGRSDRIQELHMLTLHAVIDDVEHRLGFASQ